MAEDKSEIIVFNTQKVRRKKVGGAWFYSVVDVVAILTDQEEFQKARKYWNKLAERLRDEGSEVVTSCHRLKLEAEDGKLRETDCADKEAIFRIIQSIPSKKAEPFKVWLAKVGGERIDEIENPELAQERMKDIYEKKGYSREWIDKRLRGIAVRQDLTDEWKKRGIEENLDFAILTNEISKASFGLSVEEYKKFKGLKDENLRDHMDDLELIFTMLGEASTTKIAKKKNVYGMPKNVLVAKQGGEVAGNARKELEEKIGEDVLTKENYLTEKEKVTRKEKKKKLLEIDI